MAAQTAPVETKNTSLDLDLPLRSNSQHLSRRRPVDKTKSNQNSAPNSRKSTLTQNNNSSHNNARNRNSIKYGDHGSKPKNTNKFSSGASNTGIQPSRQPSEYSNLSARNNSRKSTDRKDGGKLPPSNKANSRRDSGSTSVGSAGVHINSDDGKNNLMPGVLALKNDLENGKQKTGSGGGNNSSNSGTGNHKSSVSKQHRKSTAGSAATTAPQSEARNSNLKKDKKASVATDPSRSDDGDALTDEDDDGSDGDNFDARAKRKKSAHELARQKFALLNVDLKEATLTFRHNGDKENGGEDQDQDEEEENGDGEDDDGDGDGDGFGPGGGATSVTFSQVDKFSNFTPTRYETFRSMSAKKSRNGIGLRRINSLQNNEDLKLTISAELYRGIEILTSGELEEAKANRRFRLDAYCLGRSMLAPPMEEVEPQHLHTSHIKEESIESYDTFWETLHEIIEENNSSHLIEQIICVFTADVVRNKKTWSEDCNLLEAAIEFLIPYMKPTGYLLWIRCGNQKEWKNPHNPFRTDKVLMLNTLPTLKVWNTDKRLAGNRLFKMDNLCVMLDD